MPPLTPRTRTVSIALALAVSAIAVYLRVGGNAFVDFDDGAYVYENDAVRGGLTLDGVGWAFTATHSANWHPLTWLSHMLDVSLFGLEPAGHHWVNVLLHAASTVALFFVLRALTGAEGRSAFVAALFGLHPLHVESVAWVAERKDVLSAFFWIMTLGAWARWVRAPSFGRYWTSIGLFVLALLAKPMAVTLPAVLLLLDVWPLRRWKPFEPGGFARVKPLVAEKAPFLVLAFLSSYVTWAVQAAGSATGSLATFPFDERAANAVVAYGTYLAKIVWPASLGVFYPHPSTLGIGIELAPLALSAVLLIALFLVAWRERVRRPYLLVSGLWFLGTLVPVIGLVQVGSQAYADRYTYLPSIGVFLAVVWAVGEWLERRPEQLATVASVGAGVLIALGVVTWLQTAHWRDDDSLYRRAIDVDGRSWLAWNNLGNQHLGRDELEPALRCFEEAVHIFPRYAAAYYNLGNVRMKRMERDEAVAAYRRSLELDDSNLDAWNNLGVAFLNLGRYPEALAQFESALKLEPRHADSLENLALAYSLQKDRARAEEACRRLAAVDPARAANARSQLGLGP